MFTPTLPRAFAPSEVPLLILRVRFEHRAIPIVPETVVRTMKKRNSASVSRMHSQPVNIRKVGPQYLGIFTFLKACPPNRGSAFQSRLVRNFPDRIRE